MEAWRRTLSQFRDLFNGLAPSQRLTLAALPLVIVTALGMAMHGGTDSAEAAVLSGKVFSPDELKVAQAALEAEGLTPFRLDEPTGAGRRILVAPELIARCNSILTPSGSRTGHAAAELDKALDENWLLARSDRQRQDQIDVAKSRQVSRMLEEIPEIAEAQVLFQRSKPQGFAGKVSMSATLSVKPRDSAELLPGLYHHLRRAVAGVWGMPEANVTVLNTATGITVRQTDDADVHDFQRADDDRRLSSSYRSKIAEALAFIPNVVIAVAIEPRTDGPSREPGQSLESRSARGAELPPGSIHVAVSIPKDYYRSVARQEDTGGSSARALQSRLVQLQARIERDVAQTVARLLPASELNAPETAVSVNSYDRLHDDGSPTNAAQAGLARLALDEWAVPAGLAGGVVGTLGLVLIRRRRRKDDSATTVDSATAQTAAKGATATQTAISTALPREAPDDPIPHADAKVGLVANRASSRIDRLLEGEHAAQSNARALPKASAVPFGFLHNRGPETVLSLITDEHPQTIALILSQLPPELAAQVLGGLPSTRRLDVVRRVAAIEQTSPEVIRDLEQSLSQRLLGERVRFTNRKGDFASAAPTGAAPGHGSQQMILEQLEQKHPELFDQIRQRMFSFENLIDLDGNSLARLLQSVDPGQWSLALMGAADALKTRIVKSLSIPAAELVIQEMQSLGPVRVSDVAAAQQQIVDALHRLEEQGAIDVGWQISAPSPVH
ncbi:MAG: hypothetical protein EXS05_16820 [Planctomycetaceae bacterium]|nr:hypothetical protein [Planctomycetaceae bacterium]